MPTQLTFDIYMNSRPTKRTLVKHSIALRPQPHHDRNATSLWNRCCYSTVYVSPRSGFSKSSCNMCLWLDSPKCSREFILHTCQRQISGFDPSELPPTCQDPCTTVINSLNSQVSYVIDMLYTRQTRVFLVVLHRTAILAVFAAKAFHLLFKLVIHA